MGIVPETVSGVIRPPCYIVEARLCFEPPENPAIFNISKPGVCLALLRRAIESYFSCYS